MPRPKDGPLKKKPTEYLKQLYYDNIMFTPEAMRYLVAEVGASSWWAPTIPIRGRRPPWISSSPRQV